MLEKLELPDSTPDPKVWRFSTWVLTHAQTEHPNLLPETRSCPVQVLGGVVLSAYEGAKPPPSTGSNLAPMGPKFWSSTGARVRGKGRPWGISRLQLCSEWISVCDFWLREERLAGSWPKSMEEPHLSALRTPILQQPPPPIPNDDKSEFCQISFV